MKEQKPSGGVGAAPETAPPKEKCKNKKHPGAVDAAPEKQVTETAPPKEMHNNKKTFRCS